MVDFWLILIFHSCGPVSWTLVPEESTATVTGTLGTLPQLAESANLRAPTLIIVGEVVTLRDKLRWFE